MQQRSFFPLAFSILILGLIIHSCQKKFLCEDCGCRSSEMVADAGPDLQVRFPADEIILQADTSKASYFKIVLWQWQKISGPGNTAIENDKSPVSSLPYPDKGSYEIVLLATDACGVTARDTIHVLVSDTIIANQPPVANAGPDITDTLPVTEIKLDGSASSDPDNNIKTYFWKAVSTTSLISHSPIDSSTTTISNFGAGTYFFELTVTDAFGLSDKDTVKVTILTPGFNRCDPTDRPQITGSFTNLANSSSIRAEATTAITDNIIFFAGGYDNQKKLTSRVDMWSMSNNSWSVTNLSIARTGIATVVAGNKVFFAGGSDELTLNSSRIDIYDLVTGSWSTAELSRGRYGITTAVLGSKVFFIGGSFREGNNRLVSDKIDVFDVSSNTWSVTTLGLVTELFSITAVENKLYLAGGAFNSKSGPIHSSIFVYDAATSLWESAGQTAKAKFDQGGTYLNGKLYWSGGYEKPFFDRDFEPSCMVEVRDIASRSSTFINLSSAAVHLHPLVLNSQIYFIRKEIDDQVVTDIYNPTSGAWTKAIVTVNNISKPRTITKTFSKNGKIHAITVGSTDANLPLEIWRLDF